MFVFGVNFSKIVLAFRTVTGGGEISPLIYLVCPPPQKLLDKDLLPL